MRDFGLFRKPASLPFALSVMKFQGRHLGFFHANVNDYLLHIFFFFCDKDNLLDAISLTVICFRILIRIFIAS